MAQERKIQLSTAVDASGARAGFAEVKQGAQDMARAVGQAGQAAGSGMAAMGNGAAGAAQKHDGAARSIISSIQRTTAVMEAGERGSSRYYEALAAQRGVSVDVLKPYIDQLRQIELAQKKATGAMATGAADVNEFGVSVGQTNAALRMMPAQLTDIFTSLSGGQSPLLVLVQQGGQIKDAFGGIGNTFRVLGGEVASLFPTFAAALGGVSEQQQAIAQGASDAASGLSDVAEGANELTEASTNARAGLAGVQGSITGASSSIFYIVGGLAAAAVGMAALTVAYRQGAAESFAFDTALLQTGNVMGITTGQMREMSQALATGSYTQGAAAAALNTLASSGQIAGQSLQQFTQFALDMDRYAGQSISDTSDKLKELGEAPTKAVLKLNESLHFLTQAQLEQIKSLEEQGDKTKAAELAQSSYVEAHKKTVALYKSNMDGLAIAMDFWSEKGKKMWDALVGVGRQDTGESRIAALKTQLASLNSKTPLEHVSLTDAIKGVFDPTGVADRLKADVQGQISYLERVTQAQKNSAKAEAARQSAQEDGMTAATAVAKANTAALTKQEQLNKALGDYRKNIEQIRAANPADALLNADQIAKTEKAIREQYKETKKTRSANANAGQSELANLRGRVLAEQQYIDQLKAHGQAAAKLSEGEKLSLQLQEQLKGKLDGKTRAQKEALLVQAQSLAAAQKERSTLEERLKLETELQKQQEKTLAAAYQSADSIDAQALAQEQANATYGLGKAALAELTLAQLEKTRADLQATDSVIPGYLQAVEKQISAQKRLIAAMQTEETLDEEKKASDTAKKAAEKATAEWIKTIDGIDDVFQKGFADMVNGGEGTWKSFTTSLATTFKTTVANQLYKTFAQPFVVKIIASMLGITGLGAAGSATAANAVAGGGSGMPSLGSLSNLFGGANPLTDFSMSATNAFYNLGGMATNAGFTNLGNVITSNATAMGNFASVAGDALGYLNAIQSIANGQYGAGIGSAIGTYFGGPLGSFIGSKVGAWIDDAVGWGGETRSGATYDTDANGKAHYQQGPSGGEIAGDSARAMFDSAQASINATLKALGSTSVLSGYTAGLESSKNGKGFEFAGGYIDGKGFGENLGRSGGQFGMHSQDGQTAFADYSTQLSQSIIEALQVSDIPQAITDIINTGLNGGAASSLSSEAVTELLKTINVVVAAVNGFNDVVLTLPFENLKRLGFDAAAGLIAAAGGMDALGTGLTTYYENFYSVEERRQQTIKNINAATAGSGLDAATATKESYRALMEAQDVTTESGRTMYLSLLNASAAFASLSETVGNFADRMIDAADKFKTLQDFEYAQDMANTAIGKAMGRQLGIPGFATGGDFLGGLRIVGEKGPELEATGAARIFNVSQTRDILRPAARVDSAALVPELLSAVRALQQSVDELRRTNTAENVAVATHAAKAARLLEEFDDRGLGVVNAKTGDTLTVTVAA